MGCQTRWLKGWRPNATTALCSNASPTAQHRRRRQRRQRARQHAAADECATPAPCSGSIVSCGSMLPITRHLARPPAPAALRATAPSHAWPSRHARRFPARSSSSPMSQCGDTAAAAEASEPPAPSAAATAAAPAAHEEQGGSHYEEVAANYEVCGQQAECWDARADCTRRSDVRSCSLLLRRAPLRGITTAPASHPLFLPCAGRLLLRLHRVPRLGAGPPAAPHAPARPGAQPGRVCTRPARPALATCWPAPCSPADWRGAAPARASRTLAGMFRCRPRK